MSEKLVETPKAAQAFRDYYALGASRSLAILAQQYGRNTTYIRQLERWSSQHTWQKRVLQLDEERAQAEEQLIAAEKAKILSEQYALMHRRVEALNRLALKLEAYMDDEDNIWLPDVKAIGNGPGAERVDLIRFNDALISEYRATFADLAAEVGHRIKKKEVALAILPKEYHGIAEDEEGSEP